MTDSAPKQEPPYGLRMPPDLKARVKAAAEANNRSMNAEIVATLEEKHPAPAPRDDLSSHLVEWRDRIAAATSDDQAKALATEANAWLSRPGVSDYRIFLVKLNTDGGWRPTIVRKDDIKDNGLPVAFFIPNAYDSK